MSVTLRPGNDSGAGFRNGPGFIAPREHMLQKDKGEDRSGDNLTHDDRNVWAVQADIPERQGVTGHNVRYVLLCGLAGVIIAFVIIFATYFH